MAFSTAQEQYIKSIVTANFNFFHGGYYFAWATPTSDTQKYDLHIVCASNNMMYLNLNVPDFLNGNYVIECRGDVLQYDIITSNISSYNSDYSNRVSFTPLSNDKCTITVPAYYTTSTNLDWVSDGDGPCIALAGDILLSDGGYYYAYENEANTITLGVLLLLVVLLSFFRWVFGKSGS